MSKHEKVLCPNCKIEMNRFGKKFNFFAVLFISLIIWVFVILLPFAPFLPVTYRCRACKKRYTEKELFANK